ncbi:MAG: HNH endonuclease, partial [Acidimicrobiia bacterium]
LTTVTLLARYLTPENHAALLEAAKHQRKQQVEELVARLRPQSPVPSSIRRLPSPHRIPATAPQAAFVTLRTDSGDSEDAGAGVPVLTLEAPVRPAVIAPLAPECYKVQFTAGVEMHKKLQLAQELLRHQIPDGDIGQVLDRALTALLKDLTRQKFAAKDKPSERTTNRPAKDYATAGDHGTAIDHGTAGDHSSIGQSRYIPADVRRTVWARDGGRCAFVAQNGHRCTERGMLEFHHVVPYSAGGEATADNIQLCCRSHNGLEAGLLFGHSDDRVRLSTRSGPSWSGTREKTRSRSMRAITTQR